LLSVEAVRAFCVSVLRMVILAPARAAPLGSVTLPVMRPKLVCAHVAGAQIRSAADINKAAVLLCGHAAAEEKRELRSFIVTPEK
jgi:hypothetical protein